MLYLGVDYHKRFSYLKIMDKEGRTRREGRLSNSREALRSFLSVADGQSVAAVMEATRNWTVMYDWLEEMVDEVKLAHPLKVKAIAEARIKTDKIDAGTLAHLLRTNLVPEAYVPSKGARQVKDILRHRMFCVRVQTMVKNRIHGLIDRHPEATGHLERTDIFSRIGKARLAELDLPETDRKLLDEDMKLLSFLEDLVRSSNGWVNRLARGDKRVERLTTIPGIGKFFAVLIAHEIDDVSRFRTDRKLHSYIGLIPSTHASGGKVYHGRITNCGNRWLRWAFVEAVWPAIQTDRSIRAYYDGMKKKKDANVAKVATARHLATLAYRVLTQERDYVRR